jgi:hypothetical protein
VRASEEASGLVKCQLKLEVAVVLRALGEEWREVLRAKLKQVLSLHARELRSSGILRSV